MTFRREQLWYNEHGYLTVDDVSDIGDEFHSDRHRELAPCRGCTRCNWPIHDKPSDLCDYCENHRKETG